MIMGCGRVGSMLAHQLVDLGNSVAVIDQDASAFRRLGVDFKGVTVTGVGFDREHLIKAGIEEAQAFAAVSSGDNSNILAARTAREVFGVKNVVARIYDHRRAEVFQRLGIPTVATVSWTAEQMLRRILPEGHAVEWTDPTSAVSLVEVKVADQWVGLTAQKIEHLTGIRLAMVTRMGAALVATHDTVIQDGDIVRIIAPATGLEKIENTFSKGPVE